MKKKIIGFVLIAILVLSLAGCGKSPLNDTNTKAAEKIVNVVDNYLDGTISSSAARNTIDKYRDDLDGTGEPFSKYTNLNTAIINVNHELLNMQIDGTGDRSKILKYRNQIAKNSGQDKRRK